LDSYGEKSARDTLIDLRLAKNCMALDSRITGLIQQLGAKGSLKLTRKNYTLIEAELINKVAKPCMITGALLDRILFQQYDFILADIKLMRRPGKG
jgi:hypothetical protein